MLHLLIVVLKWLGILLLLMAALTALFLRFAPTFGAKPNQKTQARIHSSPHFDGHTFVNLTKTQASTVDFSAVASGDAPKNGNFLWEFIFPPKGKNPSKPINTETLQLIQPPISDAAQSLETTLQDGEFVWLGHSTVLFRTAGSTILTDPVFHRASPLPFGVTPFAMTHAPKASDLPFIDVVLISHDHYDHLDHKAIRQIDHKVGHFHVPLGVAAHLIRWGVAASKISEYDWYESTEISASSKHRTEHATFDTDNKVSSNDTVDDNKAVNHSKAATLQITFTPTRHFSGRRLTGHRETLWGSWAVQSPDLSVYFSGDGGYSPEFANIGKRFGGFDIAFIEDGAYSERWRDVHMLPEESAQAGIDVGAKVVLPIHWGKFDLSTHHWREPVRRIKLAFATYNTGKAADEQVQVATPRIGEVFSLQSIPTSPWWESE